MPSADPHCEQGSMVPSQTRRFSTMAALDQSVCLRKYSVTQLQPQSELQGPIPADLKYVPSAEHA